MPSALAKVALPFSFDGSAPGRLARSAKEIERSVPWPGVDQAAAYADAGVTMFTVGVSGPDYDLAPLVEAIGWRDENSPPPLSGLA